MQFSSVSSLPCCCWLPARALCANFQRSSLDPRMHSKKCRVRSQHQYNRVEPPGWRHMDNRCWLQEGRYWRIFLGWVLQVCSFILSFLHYISLHFTSLRSTSLLFTSTHFCSTRFYFPSFHFTSLLFTFVSFFFNLFPTEIAITLVVSLVLFGPDTLKSLTKDVGKAAAELKVLLWYHLRDIHTIIFATFSF